MTNFGRVATRLSVPAALAAMLALSGCVAPTASIYADPAPPSQVYTQPYTPTPYTPQPYAPAFATFCSAGAYQCAIPQGTPVGTSCACSGIGAPSYGTAQ